MAGKRILVPFNFTDYDEKALHHVIRNYAGERRSKVTLFHVYAPLPDINGYNPALGRLKATMASIWKEHREKEIELQRVRQDLIDNGFLEEQLDYVYKAKTKGIGGEIVDKVYQGDYDTVILSRKPGGMTRTFFRNIHDEVLSKLKNKEICIIT